MKTLRQLLRQPLKSAIGVTLMTLAAVILCLCVGQSLAAKNTAEKLDNQFTTIVLPSPVTTSISLQLNIPKELRMWLEEMTVTHPDIVKGISKHGFLSAYIPELTPMNYTMQAYGYQNTQTGDPNFAFQITEPSPTGMPYSCAMLVITLNEVCEAKALTSNYYPEGIKAPEDFISYEEYKDYNNNPAVTVTKGYSMEIIGTITQVVSLQEGFRDPTGMTARLTLKARTLEELQAYNLEPGKQYIVYGMDYYDSDWMLRGYVKGLFGKTIDAFDMSKMYMLTPEEQAQYYKANKQTAVARYDGYMYLNESEYRKANAISMTLAHAISAIQYDDSYDDTGMLLEVKPITQYSYKGADGETVICSEEAFIQRYSIPTITQLEDSVEAFLESQAGASWQAALERDAVNNQAFGVIGVDKLSYLTDFVRGNARVTTGRDFTAEELANGARVCILSEALAAANGLQIGDTITASFYKSDSSLPYLGHSGYLNPSASFYFSTTPFTETAEYTIVGLYSGEMVWPDVTVNEYQFSPNVMFVPGASVKTEMEYRSSILFTTPVLHNGKLEDFHALALRAGYQDHFVYYDQGYSLISENFHNYESLAKQLLVIGGVLYVVLLLLYLLLYPGAQRKAVGTMQSMGAGYLRRWGYVLASSLALVIPASVLGGLLGNLLWGGMVKALQITAESALALQIEPGVLATVAAGQLILSVGLTVCVSLFVAAPRGLSVRR